MISSIILIPVNYLMFVSQVCSMQTFVIFSDRSVISWICCSHWSLMTEREKFLHNHRLYKRHHLLDTSCFWKVNAVYLKCNPVPTHTHFAHLFNNHLYCWSQKKEQWQFNTFIFCCIIWALGSIFTCSDSRRMRNSFPVNQSFSIFLTCKPPVSNTMFEGPLEYTVCRIIKQVEFLIYFFQAHFTNFEPHQS